MSKSNKKHGKLLYKMYQTVDANPKPTPRLLAQWEMLDALAIQQFGKKYDPLTNDQKTQLHFNINSNASKEKRERERNEQAKLT